MRFAATLWRIARVSTVEESVILPRSLLAQPLLAAASDLLSCCWSPMSQPMNTAQSSLETPRIRRALPGDAEALARLRFAFRLERRAATEDEDAFVSRCSNWMRPRLRGDSRWTAWLAERESRIVGHVWLQIVEKIPNPGPESEHHAYLSNFFVMPNERNAGVGARLLNAAVAYCRSCGVDTVFLWPTEQSLPLYRRTGFDEPRDMIVLELRGMKRG